MHDAHELFDAHVDVLDDATVKHRRSHAAPLAFGFGPAKHPDDDPLFAGQSVARIGDFIEHKARVPASDG